MQISQMSALPIYRMWGKIVQKKEMFVEWKKAGELCWRNIIGARGILKIKAVFLF